MITTAYDYSGPSGFNFDATKIGFIGGTSACLLPVANPGQTFVPTISASTYDGSVLEFVSGTLRQKDQRPAGATFYAAFAAFLNANWGDGSLAITPTNGAAITGGHLDLTGSTNKYATFSATGNADSLQTGTIVFDYVPNYSGSPSANQIIVTLATAQGVGNNNTIDIIHTSDGNLYAQIAGLNVTATFVPVAGTTYTFVLSWDGTTGVTTVTINGTEAGSSSATFTRTAPIAFGAIGVDFNLGGNANFKISNLAFYSTSVIPSSSSLSPVVYATATATLPVFTYASIGVLQEFTAFAGTDSGVPQYTLNGKYWNGAIWVASDGSYAQANPISVINTNIDDLPEAAHLHIVAIYQAGNTRTSVTALTVTYTGQLYDMTNPTISPNSPLSMDSLSSFVAVVSATGSDAVRFYIVIGTTPYWWSGSAWAVSNGTLAQSNDAATIQTNAATIPVSTGVFFVPFALLHSATGSTTPSITSLTIGYDFFSPEPVGPNICSVFGFIVDDSNIGISGATMAINNPTTFFNQGLIQAQGPATAITDSQGFFTLSLAETTTVGQLLNWSVVYPGGRGKNTFGNALVPNMPSVNMASLTFTP